MMSIFYYFYTLYRHTRIGTLIEDALVHWNLVRLYHSPRGPCACQRVYLLHVHECAFV